MAEAIAFMTITVYLNIQYECNYHCVFHGLAPDVLWKVVIVDVGGGITQCGETNPPPPVISPMLWYQIPEVIERQE